LVTSLVRQFIKIDHSNLGFSSKMIVYFKILL
jgi:hypothetical protein